MVSNDPSTWLTQSSAKNVHHVLSKAMSRKPQQLLAGLVAPMTAQLLDNKYGCSVLESLVRFGTTATVSTVSAVVLQSMGSVGPKTVGIAKLVDAVLQREGVGSACALLEKLESTFVPQWCSEQAGQIVLQAALPRSSRILQQLIRSKDSAACLVMALHDKRRTMTVDFLRELCTQVKGDDVQLLSDFLWRTAVEPDLTQAKQAPFDLLHVLAQTATVDIADRCAGVVLQLPHSELSNVIDEERVNRLVTACIARCSAAVGQQLAERVFPSKELVQQILKERKISKLRLVEAVQARFKDLVTRLDQERVASSAVFELQAATQPRSALTRARIKNRIAEARTKRLRGE